MGTRINRAIAAVLPAANSRLAATYSLALWALQGKKSGDGYGFPFDRLLLEFTRRLLELNRQLPTLLELFLSDDEPYEKQERFKLMAGACYVVEDHEIAAAVEELTWRFPAR